MLQLNDEAYLSISDNAMTGFVRLGVPLDFFGRDFTSWLAQFKIMHPMVGLQVEADQSEQLLRRIERGELDVAFFKQPTGAGHGRLVVREQLVWVACRNSLSSIDRSLPLILFPEGCAYRRFALSALREHGIAFHISFVGPSFECLKTAVVEGLGITVLARGLVSPPLRVLRHRIGLPPLPTVEVVYTFGNEQRPRVVTELAHFLADSMINTGPPHLADPPRGGGRVAAWSESSMRDLHGRATARISLRSR